MREKIIEAVQEYLSKKLPDSEPSPGDPEFKFLGTGKPGCQLWIQTSHGQRSLILSHEFLSDIQQPEEVLTYLGNWDLITKINNFPEGCVGVVVNYPGIEYISR